MGLPTCVNGPFIFFKVLKCVLSCWTGAVPIATVFSTWLTVPWQWCILDYRSKNKWRMLQTAPPLPHRPCRDPAPLRSIWMMRDRSVVLWTHPTLRRDTPGERGHKKARINSTRHISAVNRHISAGCVEENPEMTCARRETVTDDVNIYMPLFTAVLLAVD